MKRQAAISAFGSVAKMAEKLGVTRQAIYQWPEDLPQDFADRVRGAMIRCGIPLETVEPIQGARPDQVCDEREAA